MRLSSIYSETPFAPPQAANGNSRGSPIPEGARAGGSMPDTISASDAGRCGADLAGHAHATSGRSVDTTKTLEEPDRSIAAGSSRSPESATTAGASSTVAHEGEKPLEARSTSAQGSTPAYRRRSAPLDRRDASLRDRQPEVCHGYAAQLGFEVGVVRPADDASA